MRDLVKSALASIDRPAWIRFFLAVGGLSLAFVTALLSTASRLAGNTMQSVVLASLSLLIAGFVGITTVPYLFRRVALTRVRDAFQYDVTRQGVVYIGLLVVIGVAALNTGNNLLFIVVAAMLGAILVSGVASAAVLRGLQMEVSIPSRVFAGKAVMARLMLRNTRRAAPSFSISVVPPKTEKKKEKRWRFERTEWGFPFKRAADRQWFRITDLAISRTPAIAKADDSRGPIFSGSVYFPYIPSRGARSAEVELLFPRRGLYVQDGLGVSTRFPFSFLVKTRSISFARELLVYPSVEPTDELFEVLPLITGEFEAFVRGRGYDLYRIREYMPEDSARHVDWKATARTGALKVREFTREDERKLRIVFDNPWPGAVDASGYEQAVALAASLGWHFAAGETDLSFAGAGYSGAADIYEFLAYLARVEPRAGDSILDRLQVTDDYNVILTARPRGSIPTPLWATSYFIFLEAGGVQLPSLTRTEPR